MMDRVGWVGLRCGIGAAAVTRVQLHRSSCNRSCTGWVVQCYSAGSSVLLLVASLLYLCSFYNIYTHTTTLFSFHPWGGMAVSHKSQHHFNWSFYVQAPETLAEAGI